MSKILDNIHSSNDIKMLDEAELAPLCAEIRERIVDTVAANGGHLASNLGSVELTVAIHRVYDTSVDRVVFDVGHQSYAHKIITGRNDEFSTLRMHGGISGYPKPCESRDDAFIAGHASNSVSAALGMARARTILGEKYDVAAVIGDGALTGGLASEGLANAAASSEPIVIILNDNNMSIGENVGGMAKMLQEMRVRPGYIDFKRRYRQLVRNHPGFYRFSHQLKERIKSRLLPSNMFSELGYYYIGPVDGHDLKKLEAVIRMAKESGSPVLVHVLTKKGKGYEYAEKYPERYHGVSGFDRESGALAPAAECFSRVFGRAVCDLAEKDRRIAVITAAMADGTGTDMFAEKFPERFFDVGIAEGHAVTMAAGMAKQGIIPVFAVYSSFLQRGYDMLLHDTALLGLHTVFAVDRAGLVGKDGETHHGIFDIAFLSSIPGMTVMCPASYKELEMMLSCAVYNVTGPVAVRYPRGGEGGYTGASCEREQIIRTGSDLTLIGYGTIINELISAADALAEKGISAEIVKLNIIDGKSYELAAASIRKTGRLLAAEEVCAPGCMGNAILCDAQKSSVPLKAVKLVNLGDGIVQHGTVSELYKDYGLDAASLAASALSLMENK